MKGRSLNFGIRASHRSARVHTWLTFWAVLLREKLSTIPRHASGRSPLWGHAGFMNSMAALTTAGLAELQQVLAPSIETPDESISEVPVDDKLRLLALLNPVLKRLVDDIAAELGSSAVRSLLLAMLAEDLSRTTGRAQIVAAGKVDDTNAHTMTQEPLSELIELHNHLENFIGGASTLPTDHYHSPSTKMLFRDSHDLLKDRLHLSYTAAKKRLLTRDLLLPHAGFNGALISPRYKELGRVFNDGTADPLEAAGTARRLLALQPGIDAQQDPDSAAERIEKQVADSLTSRNQSGTGQLLKLISSQLDDTALERSEKQMEDHFGLEFKGKRPHGFIWELCTGTSGHELLTTFSDELSNPRSKSGSTSEAQEALEQPALPGMDSSPQLSPEPNIIPAWAVSPDMPMDERPRAEFSDLGQVPPADIQGTQIPMLPGETLAAARSRSKARNLLQAFFDAIRCTMNRDPDPTGNLPMKPNIDLVVTISWDSLIGKLNDPGISNHGHLVSAGYARRLACVANVLPAVLGTESQPLDLGRTQRFFSRAQRRAMALRDRGCINPGCTMAAHRCEANHIQPWYLGGKTDLSNGALLCPICHASFHAGHFKIVVLKSIPYVLQDKVLDPEQRLRRNWFFHPQSDSIHVS
ncbi:hypothetical protein CGQ24_06565 [Arthrobacter sp. 7749]|nr:hypothetical protein CGQ24_06565 [Arthrobacter sp. 7749]